MKLISLPEPNFRSMLRGDLYSKQQILGYAAECILAERARCASLVLLCYGSLSTTELASKLYEEEDDPRPN